MQSAVGETPYLTYDVGTQLAVAACRIGQLTDLLVKRGNKLEDAHTFWPSSYVALIPLPTTAGRLSFLTSL
jgi:hypothetical protein